MQSNCSRENVTYAGFWVRLAAYAVDSIITGAGLLVVKLFSAGMTALLKGTLLDGGVLFQYALTDILLYLSQVVYFVLFTYYTGTTLGKRLFNLKVTGADEGTLTFVNVLYRETIGRFLSGAIMGIGYIMAGIDKEKRGLHDILCDTRVIYSKTVKVYNIVHTHTVAPPMGPIPPQMMGQTPPSGPVPPHMSGQTPPESQQENV